jgi:hypothetical protein
MKYTRDLNTWQFYTIDNESRTCLITEITCKMPKRTKIWKDLQVMLDEKPHIKSVGYELKE